MNQDDPGTFQQPHGYYYASLNSTGPYAQKLDEYFQAAAQVAVAGIAALGGQDPSSATAPGLAQNLVGEAAGSIGNTIGWFIDNATAISKNLETAVSQLNDANSWMAPDLSN